MIGDEIAEKSIYRPPDEYLIEVVGQTIIFAQLN